MDSFLFRMQTAVSFGVGTVAQIAERVKEFDASKVLIVTDAGIRRAGLLEKVEKPLLDAGLNVRVFDDIEPDPCLETIHKGADFFKEDPAEVIVAVGGGSPMDTAKGLRVVVENGGHIRDYAGVNIVPKRSQIPLICVPTTAGSGSEVTVFAVLTDRQNDIKITVGSPYVAADLAIVDPVMMVSAPPKFTAGAGIDALTHAVETYVSTISQPPADAWALKAIEIISQNLRTAVTNGPDMEARTQMALGSLFASMAFSNARLGINHSLGAAFSGVYHVNHGVTMGLFLPYTMKYNMISNLEKYKNIAVAMGVNTCGMTTREAALAGCEEVLQLVKDINLPYRISQLGLDIKEEDLPALAKGAMTHGMVPTNSRRPSEEDMLEIFKEAL